MKNKRILHYSLTTVLILTLVLGGVLASLRPVAAATGIICEQFGTTTQGNYTIMNNRWGTTATQCINVTNNGFQITQQDGSSSTSGAPVSYPAIYIGCHYSICSPSTNLPMQISAINNANTSVTLTYSGSGTYDAAYDIWLNDTTDVSGVQKTEIMIWLNRVGSVQPIGSPVGNITLAGQSWQVWVGNNGANNVVSYLATSLGATSFTADVKPFITDTLTRGSGFGTTSWYLTSMQMGFEPWSGGVGLAVNSFSASINSSVTPVVTPTATSGGGGGTNVFRVDASGNITVNGTPIRVKGGSWFGLQGRHEPSNDATNPSGAPMEQYIGNVFWNPTTRTYDQDIAEFKAMGINVIRLPLVPQTLTGTDPQGMAPYLKNTASVRIANSRLALETVIKKLDAAGIYVLLDVHSCSNYLDWRAGRLDARPPYVDATRDNYDFKREDSSCAATNNPPSVTRINAYDTTKWLADLRTLASLESSLGVSNIIGIDIFNEPWDYTWAEWKSLIELAYAEINAVNPNTLIFAQGISATAGNQDGSPTTVTQSPQGSSGIDPNWGENLFEAGTNPPAIPKERLVWSPHAYGPSVYVGKQFMDPAQPACTGLEGDAAGDAHCNIVINPTLLRQGWEEHFGYLKALGYAVVVGEWGGNMKWPRGAASLRDQARFSYITDNTIDEQWQNAFADYLISKGIGDTIYWSINPESGDTGGLYTTPYDPVSNTAGWGTWGPLDATKMTLVRRLWDLPIGPIPPTATVTKTATGPTPTRTRTPTVTLTGTITNTPTITQTQPPSTGLKVQYKAADTNATDNGMKPHFIVVNSGTTSVPLSNLKIRYYFTDPGTSFTPNCDYAVIGCSNITASFVSIPPVTGADRYIEVGFTTGAGSLAAGANTGEIQGRFNKADWSNFNESNDYSFDPTKTAFADWTKVTLYNNGVLVWGTPPGVTVTNTPTATSTKTRTPTPTATGPTPTRTRTPTITPTGPVTNTPTPTQFTGTPTHLPNPFTGAVPYVNPYWGGSTRGFAVNTSVWMDTIDAVNGVGVYPTGLAGHLDLALAQGANFVSIVVYNLPGRDCAALASNGLLPGTEAGLTTYKTQYIDVIASIVSQPKYYSLRVIAIIEPDSLPNLVTNLSDPDCASVNSQTLYQRGISYALNKFEAIPNMYTYIDIGHAGWLGWPSNFNPAITLISNVIKSANAAGNCSDCTDGFADNVANTQVETETFLDAATIVGGNPVRSHSFFDWNDFIDESHFAAAWKTAMQGAGIAAGSTNMVYDTSRNGWGGCGGGPFALQTCRPTATSTATTLDAYVNESRIDRRPAKGNWCNQNGAGLGKLPLTTPSAPYQAYLWIKPPAESDGSSSLIPIGPDNPDGKGFDRMCDPTYMGNSLNQNKNSNALPDAPVSGRWFQAQWDQLVANKFP